MIRISRSTLIWSMVLLIMAVTIYSALYAVQVDMTEKAQVELNTTKELLDEAQGELIAVSWDLLHSDLNVLELSDALAELEKQVARLTEELDTYKMATPVNTFNDRGEQRIPISLEEENLRLRETLTKALSSKGTGKVRDLPGAIPEDLNNYKFVKDLGMWKTTYYSPTKEECGNTKGIGASGREVVPGLSCAIDDEYWKFGTLFYVEGFGVVRADDTGSAIKGKQRMDLCTLNNDIAKELGVDQRRVWLIEER